METEQKDILSGDIFIETLLFENNLQYYLSAFVFLENLFFFHR